MCLRICSSPSSSPYISPSFRLFLSFLYPLLSPHECGLTEYPTHTPNTPQVQKYLPIQDNESKVVVHALLSTPDDYVVHLERYATSVVSIIGFGRRVADTRDPLITEVLAFMQAAAERAVIAKDFPRAMESFPC